MTHTRDCRSGRLLKGFVSGVLTLAAGLAVVAMLAPSAFAAAGPGNRSRSVEAVLTSTIPLAAVDTGWYIQTGEGPGPTGNYLAGINNGLRYRDFFVFNIPSDLITYGVCGATLSAGSNGHTPPGGTYSLYQVTTPIADVETGHLPGNTAGQAIYTDLGDGTVYGSVLIGDNDQSAVISVVFNANGVAALNSARGSGIAVGGDFASTGSIFNGTPAGTQPLTIQTCQPIPVLEAAQVTLSGLSLAVRGIGPGASLSAKVAQARAKLAAGHIKAARNTVAAFIHEVRAQADKTINEVTARRLITIANRVLDLLGS